MKYSQNERILQVTERTLVVGIDIASEEHWARAFDWRGLEHGKVLRFCNDAEGFGDLTDWIAALKANTGKDDVILGMEPTGHYWFNLAQRMKLADAHVVLVNPFHVKRSKELDDNSPAKNDRKDPKTIAMLVKDGRFTEPYMPEGVYAELRILMNSREKLVTQMSVVENRVARWLTVYFPEFLTVFADWSCRSALMVLRNCPLPEDILKAGASGVNTLWRSEKLRAVGEKRAHRLLEAAEGSMGILQGLSAARHELYLLLEEYAMLQDQLARTMVLIETAAMQVPGMEELLKIRGVGLVTAAGIVAEIGDIHRFEVAKQVQKYAGLSLWESSSGKHKGVTRITKRGRKRLRRVLFILTRAMVAKNAEFQALHHYYTTRKDNPLKKMQSMILLCNKLIRIFFVILKSGVAYDGAKLMTDRKEFKAA